jgi:cbb3-type cytochrome oxidase cytochrome c subunit
MKFHPIVFALIAYGITVVIAVCVAAIVKVIAFFVQRKKESTVEGARPES